MKTGGTWVRAALTNAGVLWDDVGDQHANYIESVHLIQGDVFTIVRHPFDWYKSFWAFRRYKGWGGNLPIGHGGCIQRSLDHFILACVKDYPKFLTDYFATFAIDTVMVMRNDTLAQNLCDVLAAIDEPFDKDKLLATPRQNEAGALPEYGKHEMSQICRTLLVQSEIDLFIRWGFEVK